MNRLKSHDELKEQRSNSLMDNCFVNGNFFDWRSESRKARLINRMFEKVGFVTRLRSPYATGFMTNVDQRVNLYHLVSQVLAYDVPGDLAEVGTYAGSTAVLIQWIIDREGCAQKLHIYDSFEKSWGIAAPLDELKRNFEKYCGKLPEIHAGRFEKTIPSQLPDTISFINIDCGWGGPAHTDIDIGSDGPLREHGKIIRHVLEYVYPRMPKGAICSLIDYWRPGVHDGLWNPNPEVQPTVDAFLADKRETVSVLFAREYIHGYFRKL